MIDGQRVPGSDLFPFKHTEPSVQRVDQLREAFEQQRMEFHGNFIWGSSTRVFGAQLSADDDATKTALIREALVILNAPHLTPHDKAVHIISDVKGFGENSATGLVMVFHPEEFAIANRVSTAAVAELGLPVKPLAAFEASTRLLRDELGAGDFIELDWFLYGRHQASGVDDSTPTP